MSLVGWVEERSDEAHAAPLMVYVASDYPLPSLAWDEARPAFHVAELPEADEPVRGQFSEPHVYAVGSHEGCGCGFQYGQYDGSDDDPAARDSRRRLAAYLAVALQHQSAVELYACWDGDQTAPPEHGGRVRPVDLVRDRTFFREKELLVVSEARD
jgi:hypothetical protein